MSPQAGSGGLRTLLDIPALLVVTSHAPPERWDELTAWYGSEHSPDAVEQLGAREAIRFQSLVRPGRHVAMYAFDDAGQITDGLERGAGPQLMEAYDRRWQGEVVRERDIYVPLGHHRRRDHDG